MTYQDRGGLAFVADQSTLSPQPANNDPCAAQARIHRFPQRPATPEQVLKSFNTRAFKREQPDNPALMLDVISRAISAKQPVPFVMYWGKGLRPLLAAPEHTCLDYLASMLRRVPDVYRPGAKLSLVFTDTHASLNGHSQESIASYFSDFTAAATSRGFEVSVLSSMMTPADRAAFADIAKGGERPPDQLMASLAVSAGKWFKGEGTCEEGALRYYRANMVERLVIGAKFPGTIFVTFNGSGLRSMFPDNLPIFYMYSVRHGISDKPWFLPPDFSVKARHSNANVELRQPGSRSELGP
jgi:hypothetical protein